MQTGGGRRRRSALKTKINNVNINRVRVKSDFVCLQLLLLLRLLLLSSYMRARNVYRNIIIKRLAGAANLFLSRSKIRNENIKKCYSSMSACIKSVFFSLEGRGRGGTSRLNSHEISFRPAPLPGPVISTHTSSVVYKRPIHTALLDIWTRISALCKVYFKSFLLRGTVVKFSTREQEVSFGGVSAKSIVNEQKKNIKISTR